MLSVTVSLVLLQQTYRDTGRLVSCMSAQVQVPVLQVEQLVSGLALGWDSPPVRTRDVASLHLIMTMVSLAVCRRCKSLFPKMDSWFQAFNWTEDPHPAATPRR